ncbi:MAG TPA: DnaD domain protein, partial [Clostridiales bacterium]|nr:DnaD domain protein [Clostridiales bacterium]
ADNYPLELIQEAFKRAGIKNATSIRYVEKILISWERKGIKSLAQLEAYENNLLPAYAGVILTITKKYCRLKTAPRIRGGDPITAFYIKE